MLYKTLGTSDLKVSRICLGTMTWGEQNTQAEGFSQMDYAVERGINFFDCAEMYPVPPRAETQGSTETIIGHWFKERGTRDQVILATKVSGPAAFVDYLREGPQLNAQHIHQAIDDSLKRLQTDYIDLYQVHWPARPTNFFGQLSYIYPENDNSTAIEETLAVLHELVDAGKIRYIGLSNETPWGVHRYLELAKENSWPRIVSIQNPYNLLNRSFEIGLSEFTHHEQVDLLAYSPLAFGVLSGKYIENCSEPGARLNLWGERYGRYTNERGIEATRAYVKLARDHGLSPTQMSLAFINSRPFLGANIIGASTLEQLKENIESIQLSLTEDVINQIEAIHLQNPNPCP